MPSIGDIANDVAAALYEARLAAALVGVVGVVVAVVVARRLGWFAAARRHPGRTTALAVAALAITVPLGWYLASPIFIRTSLVEAAPTAAPTAPPAVAASPTPIPPSDPSAAPSIPPTPSPSPTPTPFVPTTVATGEFSGTDEFHYGSGTASLIEIEPGRFHLRLEDFSVRNGPDLYVYLSTDPGGYADDALELGLLKATDGSFGYDLPEGADPSGFRSAIIWCKQFSHLFAVAPFEA